MARTAVVSGGGTGIGRAVAARFADAGDNVILVGRRADVLADTAVLFGPTTSYVAADLATVEGAQRVVDYAVEKAGSVDVIVAAAGGNAGIGPRGDLEGLEGLALASAVWNANLQLNVLTAVHLVEGLKPHLAEHARIVLFSSIAAYRGSGSGSYAAAKSALHPYAIDLSAQLGDRGVTVNVIAPGYIEDTEFFADTMTPRRRGRLAEQTHNQRPGTPADIAALTAWLTSPEAGHVTAQIIQSNGGAFPGR
ncbi:SDR family NAD(P)-dependent oxidoreductase [Glycomyces harbinensis]|uniref:3-oxoacyl-[acyl-carrier protein] reductase n=1 Tax=Glycomyces harbinensis TaxID=58114 RepID=A0A1G7C2W7_9ACTN|nr:SDR family oxidoreductase [Glycomyces harbinensis]SDE33110.1 3-oxoacyl-[acyl-carrier protein] reductase [Glycomyces harbinensis]